MRARAIVGAGIFVGYALCVVATARVLAGMSQFAVAKSAGSYEISAGWHLGGMDLAQYMAGAPAESSRAILIALLLLPLFFGVVALAGPARTGLRGGLQIGLVALFGVAVPHVVCLVVGPAVPRAFSLTGTAEAFGLSVVLAVPYLCAFIWASGLERWWSRTLLYAAVGPVLNVAFVAIIQSPLGASLLLLRLPPGGRLVVAFSLITFAIVLHLRAPNRLLRRLRAGSRSASDASDVVVSSGESSS